MTDFLLTWKYVRNEKNYCIYQSPTKGQNQIDRWIDRCLDRWIDIWIDRWIDIWIDIWNLYMDTHKLIDGYMNKLRDRQIDGYNEKKMTTNPFSKKFIIHNKVKVHLYSKVI